MRDTIRFGVFLSALFAASANSQVTTYHYDTARTGAVLNETILTASNVNVNTFGKLFSLPVDGQIYAQPLYIPSVTIPQRGVHNVLYVATENNSVYAFDADSAGSPLWKVNLGPAMPQTVCCLPKDLGPQIGILSTPVIDPNSGLLYVVAESYENQAALFRLHALDITTGADRLTPVVIRGSVRGNSSDSQNGVLAFAPIWHWQRPGLLLANGNIYIGFGSHGDQNPYHGWLFAYSAATLQQTGVLCFSPDESDNGVWQGGVGLAADANGYVYLETGNGPLDANAGGADYGDSVVKVGTSGGGLTVLDYFSPSTQAHDATVDEDLGSAGVMLIPGTSLGAAGGKNGKLYLFNTGNLGGFDTGPGGSDGLVQEWQATFDGTYGPPAVPGGFWGGNYLFYNSTLYGFGERDSLKAFAFNGSQFTTVASSHSNVTVPSGFSNDPAMSISANGLVAGTGVVWTAFCSNGNADGTAQPGEFHAFDAANVGRELWNSAQNGSRDSSGTWAKWSPPLVANGKVYLASFDNSLNVYGLLASGGTISPTAGTPQTAAVNSAFSTALAVVVKDVNNRALSGVTVTFTTPATGASATFGGSITATAVTNGNGVATAPALTANGQTGAFAVSAVAAGVGSAASFYLTNVGGSAPSITSLAGTPQSVTVNSSFATPLQAIVKDASNNPIKAVTVNFSAPATGASASFSGSATATAVTNAGGIATAPTLTANSQTGSYTVTASTAGVSTPASFSLTNTAASGGSGALTGTGNSATTTVNLTAEGSADWVHWGTTSLTRKNGVTPQISNYSVIGAGTVQTYTDDPRAVSWTDGTPTAAGSDNAGVFINSLPNGFSFTAPADLTTRVLTVHVGGFSSGGTLTAHLSDGSGADFVDTTSSVSGAYDRNYTLSYHAASAGQTLKVSWVNSSGSGNATLNGAALSSAAGASIAATAGTPQSATVSTAFATALQATVKSGSTPVNGVTVTFTAPATGASASFSGSATATAVTNAGGIATAPTLTASGQTGSYTVTASTAGVGTPAGFSLTNTTASGGGGALTGAGNSATTTVNLTAEGSADWVHWGTTSLTRKNGVTPQISNYSVIGAGTVQTYNNDPRALSWTDGTPTAAGSDNAGVYLDAVPNGFSFTAPADSTTRVLTVHVGGYFSGGTLTAHLSDGSAIDFVDTTTSVNSAYDRNYTLSYHAASAGQTLRVSWVNSSGTGNVTLNGAALSSAAGASIAATAGTPQSTTVSTAFATALQATVKNGTTPVNGVTVTFTAPATGASASFSGSATATAVTNAGGIATAPTLTANSQTGAYTVTASTAGVSTPASFSLTNTAASGGSGALTGAGNSATTTVNLTAEGSADWVHWGTTSLTRKNGVTPQISNYSVIGAGTVQTYTDDPRAVSWTDGTPTAAGSDNAGVFIDAVSNGFSFTAPADLTTRVLTVHVGGYFSGGTLTAHLSDGSAADFVDTTTSVNSAYDRNYTLTYSAASASRTLTVTWVNSSGTGNVTLNGAALSSAAGASIAATAGTPQSATVSTAFATALQATVKSGSTPVNGVTVTFTAPATGASASFSGSATSTAVTNAGGIATAPTLTANGQTGSYTVTASTAGVGATASFSLTNAAATGGSGALTGAANSAATTANLTNEGALDWVHWGRASLTRKKGVTPQISSYSVIGTASVQTYNNDPRALSWTDGTPTATGSDHDGVYINSLPNGFSFTAPADLTTRVLTVHVGGYFSGGTLTAHLSDGSATDFVDATTSVNSAYDRNYTLTYSAASAGQTLTVSWVNSSGSGNVTLNGAALAF